MTEGETRLVVEGRLEQVKERDDVVQTIKLSTTFDYFAESEAPAVSGANVQVIEQAGTTYTFTEDTNKPGYYSNNVLIPRSGGKYTLQIVYESETYEATETFYPVASIDSVYAEFEEENNFEDEGYRVKIDFRDEAGRVDYYLWEVYTNGEIDVVPDPGARNNRVAEDEFFDGQNIIGYQPNEEVALEIGDEVLVKQLGISQEAYDFYYLFFDQTGRTGSLFDTPPARISGNIRNTTRPEHYPLGYFMVCQVSEARIIITE